MPTSSPARHATPISAAETLAERTDIGTKARGFPPHIFGAAAGVYRLPKNRLVRYGAAILLVSAAMLLSLLFRSQLSSQPFMLFYGVVVGTAFLAGLEPALVATALSVLSVEFIFVPSAGSLANVQDITALTIFGGVSVLVSWLADRTERSREELIEQRRSVQDTARRALLLAEAGRLMAETARYEEGLQDLADLLVREIADLAIAYAVEDDVPSRVAVAHADEGQRELVQRLIELRGPFIDEDYGVGAAIRAGEPVLIREVEASSLELAARGEQAHLDLLRQIAPASTIVLPLRARGRLVGGLVLVSSSWSDRHYDEQDLNFAQELGGRIAIALDNARLLAEAQAATRARERMMAVVAHDLRNPLNVILGAADLLTSPDAEASRTKTGQMLSRATRQAADLIEDLLDVSRMKAGKFGVSPEPFPVAELLRQVERDAGTLTREKRVELEIHSAVDGSSVYADRSCVHRIFSNLLGNAVQHSPHGGHVLLSARSDGEQVVFSVADEGPGIPQKDLPYVFQQFWQGEAKTHGAGLGLAIVRGIVEAHGGRVWVDRTNGEGTSLSFTLLNAETL